eukprot:3411246-Rhodomonas_salina.1
MHAYWRANLQQDVSYLLPRNERGGAEGGGGGGREGGERGERERGGGERGGREGERQEAAGAWRAVSYTHLRAHETEADL